VIKERRRLVGLDVFHDFAGRDDVELSEGEGRRIAVDEFVIQTDRAQNSKYGSWTSTPTIWA
jgi:hypothetical protein